MNPAHANFAFGKNWQRFLRHLIPEQVRCAEKSLTDVVGDLQGKTFVDVGCGSGLVSLAAMNLGAKSVLSFDCDLEALDCAVKLREFYHLDTGDRWNISEADILNRDELWGIYDVVYSWGVLHHTGAMRRALESIIKLVAPKGLLFVSIYNDQGGASKRWLKIKQLYNSGWLGRWGMLALVALYLGCRSALRRLLTGENPLPFKAWGEKKNDRGMSVLYDLKDWTGGLPFEVAKPEEIIHFYQEHGFRLIRLKTCAGSHGCNQFLFSNG